MTTNASYLCPQCGHAIPEDAANGLCPRCVFAKAMAPTSDGITAPYVPPSLESVRAAFPHLEVTGLIGSGGMGSVFKARQPQLDRFVALKILPSELADQSGFSARFQREAQALARLSHPHIVTVHDFGQAGGLFYLVMEFVDGVNLRQLLQSKRLTPKEALSIVPPICEALQCAHDHGIVHRDIKPENLLIDKAGVVKIADFGIAKMILNEGDEPARASEQRTGASASLPFGTPDYAAPEQSNGNADHRADIYSLGVVLYEMLTGERPTAELEAPSKRVQVDIRIDEIVLRALEKTPELRFATASDFRTQVEALAKLPEQTSIDYSKFNRDPANWHFYAFYFCREDPRLIVPKRIAGLGWTVNLARPLAIPFVLAICGVVWSALELARDQHPLHAYDKWTLVALILGLAFLCHRLSNPSPNTQRHGWLELPGASSWARRYIALPACLAGGSYAAHLFYVLSTASRLPARVATHFGERGLPNGWMTKTEQLAFMGLMPVGMTAFLGLALWMNIKNPTVLSLPNRDFWLAPKRRRRTTCMLAGSNLVLSAILTGFMSTLNHVILSANSTVPPKLEMSALLIPIIFLLSMLTLWGTCLAFRFARKDEAVLAPVTPRKPRAFLTLVIIVGLGLLFAAATYLRLPAALAENRVNLKYIDAALLRDRIKAEHPELASVVLRTETNGYTVILDATSASLEPLQKYLAEIDHPPEGIVLSGIVTEFPPDSPPDAGKVVAKPTIYTLLGNDSSIFVGAKDGLLLEFTIKTSRITQKGDDAYVLQGTVTESMRDAPAQTRKIFALPTLRAKHGGLVVFTHRLQDGRDIGLTIKILGGKPPPLKTPATVLGTSSR